MKPSYHIGCSSYNETYWKGVFYPEDLPRKEWFGFYAKEFKTYEVNGSFYKFPTVKIMRNWYDRSPENNLFSVKAPKLITHFRKFSDCGQQLKDFYSACQEGLREKLACILFQLPPSFAYTEERLALLVGSMHPDFKNVLEFRHESWWTEPVFEQLAVNKITFCNVSYPGLPEKIVKTTDLCYFRFHGNKRLFYSGYSDAELHHIKAQIDKAKFTEAFVYFNNTASEKGVENALAFKNEML